MEISLNEITGWIGAFLWPFLRISALFVASPVFGARTVPVKFRIILAVSITIILQSSLPFIEEIDPLSAEGLVIIFEQIAIGVVMGMILQVMFATLVMAGQTMATSMGLGFASAVDPQNGVQVTMVGQFYLILATLFFLSIDAHLLLLQILADSFVLFPIGENLISVDIFWNFCIYTATMFVSALLIALPIIVGVLLVNLGFGVITRAAPQLNIFSLGFPITMTAGFILMFLSLKLLFPLLLNLFTESFEFMTFLVN